jgi:hypothetical protein
MRDIVAMDAMVAFNARWDQFSSKGFQRDLNKAYCAFFSRNSSNLEPLATGTISYYEL